MTAPYSLFPTDRHERVRVAIGLPVAWLIAIVIVAVVLILAALLGWLVTGLHASNGPYQWSTHPQLILGLGWIGGLTGFMALFVSVPLHPLAYRIGDAVLRGWYRLTTRRAPTGPA